MKLSKKTTPSLQSNMEEIQWCFQVFGTGCLGHLHSEYFVTQCWMQSQKAESSSKVLGLPAGQWPQTHFKKNPTMIQDKTLDCSEVASNLSPDLKSREIWQQLWVGTLLIWENWSSLHKRGEKTACTEVQDTLWWL